MVNQESKLLVCGLLEVWGADAQSQLDLELSLGILYDVGSSLENKDEFINNTFNTENLMSDCCNTQKNLTSCLWISVKAF